MKINELLTENQVNELSLGGMAAKGLGMVGKTYGGIAGGLAGAWDQAKAGFQAGRKAVGGDATTTAPASGAPVNSGTFNYIKAKLNYLSPEQKQALAKDLGAAMSNSPASGAPAAGGDAAGGQPTAPANQTGGAGAFAQMGKQLASEPTKSSTGGTTTGVSGVGGGVVKHTANPNNPNMQASSNPADTKEPSDSSSSGANAMRSMMNLVSPQPEKQGDSAPAATTAFPKAASGQTVNFNADTGEKFATPADAQAWLDSKLKANPNYGKGPQPSGAAQPAAAPATQEPAAKQAGAIPKPYSVPGATTPTNVNYSGLAASKPAPQATPAAQAATPAAQKKHTGGKVAGQVSQTPNAIRKRDARAQKSIAADRARLLPDYGGVNESNVNFYSKFLGIQI